jgi:hypothetical protein
MKEAEPLGLFRCIELPAQRGERTHLIAQGEFDDLDIRRWHRNADRHFVQAELRRFAGDHPGIAVECRDQPARGRVPLLCLR